MNNPVMEYEYAMIIKLKEGLTEERISYLRRIICCAFNNKAGNIQNASSKAGVFIFQGNENLFGCLNLGMINICETIDNMDSFEYFIALDRDDPSENSDVIALFKEHYNDKA